MDIEKLTAIISIILALSIASERLVEIIKGLIPALNEENKNPLKEGRRRSCLQFLAVLSGIFTAYLANGYLPQELSASTNRFSIIGLGLLASGGSGLWNSILTYFTSVKDIKKSEAINKKLT